MSDIDTIVKELRAVAAGIERARANAAAAGSKAQEISARAAQSGFAGIATGMSQVRTMINELQAQLAAVNRSAAEAAVPVTAAPKELSPQQTIAALAPVTEKVDAVRDGIALAVAKIDEAHRRTAAVLQGGQPGPLLAALAAVKHLLIQITQRCAAAKQHVNTVMDAARQVGNQGN